MALCVEVSAHVTSLVIWITEIVKTDVKISLIVFIVLP